MEQPYRVRSDFDREVRLLDPVWIPMRDGTRLAARLWLPEGAAKAPVPAVVEYIPYRRRDFKARRDAAMHGWFAGHGYACVRVDLRGSGDSEGLLHDEYLEQELVDGEDVLAWVANQSWCDGAVGMIGISWGGFNGLQLAARQPPALRAVVSVCSTEDRYSDDVHYMGGCLLGDNLSWSSVMFGFNAYPPDPAIVGERWREMWQRRLAANRPWVLPWLEHPHRDEYWEHGSVCQDIGRIQVPVLAASGWADGYTNAVFRMLENLESPCRGLVGPWSHRYPHEGMPGPAVGFLQECKRWWDRWLRGEESGVMAEPALRVWIQDSIPPSTRYQERPGRWVAEPSWPSPRVETRRYELRRGYSLAPLPSREIAPADAQASYAVQSPLSVGFFAGKWCSYSYAPDLPGDQREEDGGSLVFESEALQEPLVVLGAPELELCFSASKPVAQVAVRLSDICPNREATRMTYGVLNLTHREGHAQPQPLEPGRRYVARVALNALGYKLPAGHHLRISLSSSYWPLIWPSPEPAQLTIHTGASQLVMPVRTCGADEDEVVFEPAEGAPAPARAELAPPHHAWEVRRDLASDRSALCVTDDRGHMRLKDIDLETHVRGSERYEYTGGDYESLRAETHQRADFGRGEWRVGVETTCSVVSDARRFRVHATLDAYVDGRRCFSRNWDELRDRDLL